MAFRVRAVNTASDSENRIHHDTVAAEYGFRGGLVPGVTVYGYMASAVLEHFGPEWLERGAMDVRFNQPVYEGEDVEVTIEPETDGRVRVEAGNRAAGIAWIGEHAMPSPIPSHSSDQRKASAETLAAGTVMGSLTERLDLKNARMSQPLDPAIDKNAHPAILIALANRIFVSNYELGPWIHVASEVRKFRSAQDGEELQVRARIDQQFEKKGHEFIVFDVLISADGPIESIRHTAIWRPRVSR